LFRIRPDYKKILPTTLVIYLNSKIGRAEIEKYLMVGNQANFSPAKFREILIPKFGTKLQTLIDHRVWKAYSNYEQSKKCYKEAQTLLLSELSLTTWQPKHQLTFVRKFSDTKQVRRFDAEYFQPKYDEIVKAIKSYSDGWDTLGNLVTLNDKNFKPKNKQRYQYIELANIVGNGEITGCMSEEGQNLPTRARRKVAKGNVIVSSIEGSLSCIALIEKEYNQALCSTGFHVINSKSYNSETLLILLKSIVGQLQLKKACSGTILTAINKDEFGKIIFPNIDESKQNQIQQKVTESFAFRKQSKYLLECTKKAVEMVIKQDEKIAMSWLIDRKTLFVNRSIKKFQGP